MIKKLTLTSLVASACLFSNVYAADTLAEAFTNGKVKGELRSYFFQEDYDATGRSSITHFGGFINYETASYYGLTAGTTFQVSSVADISGVNKFASDEEASGSVMSEAFVTYTRDNTSLKAGRQFIGTPLLAGSGSRMIRQSFQGYVATNTDIPNTKLVAAYVDRFQARTDGAGNPGKFTKSFNTNVALGDVVLEDGAYTLYLENKSVKDLTIQAQYLDATNVFSTIYADADYKIGTAANLYVVGQYMGTNYDATNLDGHFFAARIGGAFDKFSFKLSASSNTSDANVESGLGYGADWALTGAEINGGYYAYFKDTKAYQINLGTNVAGIDANIIHSSYDIVNATDVKETDVVLSYDLMKNLNLNILQANFDGGDKNYETRVKLTYKF